MANFIQSSNPVLSEDRLKKVTEASVTNLGPITREESMTVSGAIDKTLILFALLMVTTYFGFTMASPFLMISGAIAGLICVIAAVMKPQWSSTLAPGYALFNGLFLGAVSSFYAQAFYPGIILQAILLTMGTLLTMLLLYKWEVIKVTEKFRSGVIMATGAVLIVYLFSFIGSFFGFQVPYLHDNGIIGIGISVVIIGIASLNLLLDFDNFEKGEKLAAPKYMEWFAGMGLLITIIWLYVEFLRLLSKLNRN